MQPSSLKSPKAKRAKVARGHEDVVPVDNEVWVSDPANPRVLRPKQPGVINRDYVEMMAIPRFPATTSAPSVDVPDEERRVALPEAPLLANAATAIRGRVIVIEGSNSLVEQTGNGFSMLDHRGGTGSSRIMNQVLGAFGDNFDFITVFTTFDDPGVAAYYLPLKQDVDGLGECQPRAGKTFGCLFDQFDGQLENLQGFVFMNSLPFWQDWDFNYDGVVHPFSSFDSAVYATLGQEIAHRWGSGLRFVDPRTDRVSNLLLGRDGSHWAAYVDSDASVMDGWDWVVDGDRFDLVGDMDRFSTLDLYTLGALPVAAAKPFFVIDDAFYDIIGNDRIGLDGRPIGAADVLQLPSDALMESLFGMQVGAVGEQVPVTIQDVVDAEGNRCPDPDNTQRTFRQGVVLVTRPGQSIAQVESQAAQLNEVLATWEDWWLDRTDKRLKLCTELDTPCVHAQQRLTGGKVEHEGTTFNPGAKATVKLTVQSVDATVEGAVISLRADGDAADFMTFPSSVEVGRVGRNEEKTVSFEIDLDAAYPCGTGAIIVATLDADNAATVVEEIRFFPGYKTLFEEDFASDEHRFEANADGKDGTTSASAGALRFQEKIELSCDMSQRTPERDASPDNDGAFVTGPGTDHVPNLLDNDPGEGAELDGDTSLWSPVFDLEGTLDPELRFAYWFDGEPGDSLLVQLSGDDEKTFVTGREITESFHGWVVGRVSVRDVFGNVPPKVTARFIFEGNGALEGGIDDVRMLDFDGECTSFARGGFCGCSENGDSTPAAPLALLMGLVGLRGLRRRRQTTRG